MYRKLAYLLLSLVILIPTSVAASEPRPKVGLVLSGGGARGAAHAGVLKVLEELHIPIDYIAGTSMGSIVAGLYASGLTADQIADALTGMDWDGALQDSTDREYSTMVRKREADRFSIPISPGLRDGKLQVPNAAIQGQNIILALQELTDPVAHIKDFDDLVIPFRAVATDIITGKKVVLDSGDLATAMRASMSVPGVFAPIQRGEHLLVDGGISDNIPVDVARELGADILIVVDISTPLRNKDEIDSLLTIADQLSRLMTQNNGKAQLATLTDRDILLAPELGDITSSSFDRSAEAIVIGESAARARLAELAAFSISEHEYEDFLAQRPVPAKPDRTILSIDIKHDTNFADAAFQNKVDLEPGTELDLKQLEQNLTAIYGIGHFQSVGYELIQQPGGRDIQIRATRKAIGPNFLHFGLEAQGYVDADMDLDVLAGYTKTELNSTGGEWTSIVGLGTNARIETYLYQPFGKGLNVFFFPRAAITREQFNLYEDDDKIAEYKIGKATISADLGYQFGNRAALLGGLEYSATESDLQVGDTALPEPDDKIAAIRLWYRYDTLDDIDFPSHGSLILLKYVDAREDLGSDLDYSQWQASFGTVKSWGKYSLLMSIRAGGTNGGETELTRPFRLGGFGRLTGLKPDQLLGRQMGLTGITFYRRFDGIKLLPTFIGGIFEYGGAWNDWDDANKKSSIFSYTGFMAVDSPFGPAQFGMGFTDQGDSSLFFRIGRMF